MALPPEVVGELFYDGVWNDVTNKLRQTEQIKISRGMTSESAKPGGKASPTSASCVLDNRDFMLSPRNPESDLFNKIGRNTPMRISLNVGSAYASTPGTDASKLTTSDNASLAVVDLDLRFEAALDDWGAQVELAGRYQIAGDNRSWALGLNGSSQLYFIWSPDGTLANRIVQTSTTALKAYNGQQITVRVTLDVDNGGGGYELRFYTGRTVDDVEWKLLGDPIIGAATTSVFDGAAGIELGSVAGLSDDAMSGKIFAFKLFSTINGSTAASMYTSDATVGATSFSSGGVTWTVEGDAQLINKQTRHVGEIPEWPPTRDLSGNDNYMTVQPSGVTRRMNEGSKPLDSALFRFIKNQGPIECYPLTDGELSSVGRPINGHVVMTPTVSFGSERVQWSAGVLASWLENVVSPVAGTDGTLYGRVPYSASATATGWDVDFFFSGWTSGEMTLQLVDVGANTDADNRHAYSIEVDQTNDRIQVFIVSAGSTSSSATLLITYNSPGVFDEALHHVRLNSFPFGGGTNVNLSVDGVLVSSVNTAVVVKALSFVRPGWFLNASTGTNPRFGFLTYWLFGNVSAAEIWDAANGFAGERAGDRIERLGAENNFVMSVAGVVPKQTLVGAQRRKKLLELVQEASRSNFGFTLDARDRLEVVHRGQSTLWNQTIGLTVDFSAGLVSPPFRPRDDDKLTENDVSVQRDGGTIPSRKVLESGKLSVQDFPNGVGRYDVEYTYSLFSDDQAPDIAGLLLHLGTFDGVRYARLTFDLANPRVFALVDQLLRLDQGDVIRLNNIPRSHGVGPVDVMVVGYAEEIGPKAWKMTFYGIPGAAWSAFTLNVANRARLNTAGSELTAGIDSTQTSVGVTTTASQRWIDTTSYAAHFPFDVIVGGERMTVTDISGTTLSQTMTVTRSVNGVVKAHDAGEDVSLFSPTYFPL